MTLMQTVDTALLTYAVLGFLFGLYTASILRKIKDTQ